MLSLQAKPLDKLCEYEGRALPDDYKSDCWNDVDETEFACSEKERILLQLDPPGSENAIIDNYIPIFRPGEFKIRHTDNRGNSIEEKEDSEGSEEDEEEKKRTPKKDFQK